MQDWPDGTDDGKVAQQVRVVKRGRHRVRAPATPMQSRSSAVATQKKAEQRDANTRVVAADIRPGGVNFVSLKNETITSVNKAIIKLSRLACYSAVE